MIYLFQKKTMSNVRGNQMLLWLEALGKISYRVIMSMSTINPMEITLSLRDYIIIVLTEMLLFYRKVYAFAAI